MSNMGAVGYFIWGRTDQTTTGKSCQYFENNHVFFGILILKSFFGFNVRFYAWVYNVSYQTDQLTTQLQGFQNWAKLPTCGQKSIKRNQLFLFKCYCFQSRLYSRGGQHTARGPNLARQSKICGPRRAF